MTKPSDETGRSRNHRAPDQVESPENGTPTEKVMSLSKPVVVIIND